MMDTTKLPDQIWDWYRSDGSYEFRYRLVEYISTSLQYDKWMAVRLGSGAHSGRNEVYFGPHGTWVQVLCQCYCGQDREEDDYCCSACRAALQNYSKSDSVEA